MILVVCATERELRGFSPSSRVSVLNCGIGPVEAAIETSRALAVHRYGMVVNVGIGGAFTGRAKIGEALAVEREWLAELGLEGDGPLSLPTGLRLENVTQAHDTCVARARAAGLRIGSGITVARVTATDTTAARLNERFGVDVESMEGFAVLRAAELAGVAGIEIRGISNYVGDRAKSQWDFRAGARAAVAALETFLAHTVVEQP